MKDYEIHRSYEEDCVAEYIRDTYPNLFSEEEIECIAQQANDKMNDYHLYENEAVLEVLEEGATVTLKRNVLDGDSYRTFESAWSGYVEAVAIFYPDMCAEEFGKDYTPEMGEKLYQWLVESGYIDEDEE